MSSEIQYTTQAVDFQFDKEPALKKILKNDSEEGVLLLKLWLENHPTISLKDGDRLGQSMLVYAMSRGNVSLVQYIVKTETKMVNILTSDGSIVFSAASQIISNQFGTRPSVEKFTACARIVMEGGYKVDLLRANMGCTSVNNLKTEVDFAEEYGKRPDFEIRNGQYLRPLIKMQIQAGADYQGKSFFGLYSESKYIKEALAEIAGEGEKKKLLALAHVTDKGSPLSKVPRDIITIIGQKIGELYEMPAQTEAAPLDENSDSEGEVGL